MSSAADQGGYAGLASGGLAIFPGFVERQREAALEIYEVLLPHIRKGAIDVVVDLGCGSGEVLIDIAEMLSEGRRGLRSRDVPFILIGLDSSEALIGRAQQLLATTTLDENVKCIFASCDPDRLPFNTLKDILDTFDISLELALRTTAILCLGHTIFHLPYLPALCALFRSAPANRPLLWIVDIYHSWDLTLHSLESSHDGLVQEPRSFTDQPDGKRLLNVLFTKRMDGDPNFIERGLIQTPIDDQSCGTTIIVTKQLKWSSADLIKRFAEARYVLTHRNTGPSGYGEVVRLGFSRANRTFPLPALFLDSKTIPDLSFTERTGAPSQATPLHVVADWIGQSSFIAPESERGFDFVIVEVAPWYNSPKGLLALDQEVLICGKAERFSQDQLATMLDIYRDTLFQAQSLSLGPFLHPSFAGYDGAKDWAKAHFSFLQSTTASEELDTDAERLRYALWQKAFEDVHTVRAPSPSKDPEFPRTPPHVRTILERNSTRDLVTQTQALGERLADYSLRLVNDHRPTAASGASFRSIKQAELARDLDLTQALLHEQLRRAFKFDRDEAAPFTKTVFLGIPLRSLLDERPDLIRGLPERYRGGVWVFAGTRGEFGPRQNSLMGDLARLTVLLENTAIDAKASDAVHISIIGKYKALYEQEPIETARGAWMDAEARVHEGGYFDIGSGHHSLPEWRALIEEGHLPEIAGRVQPLASEILSNCIKSNISLTLWPALVLLRSLYLGAGYLSASLITHVLRQDDGAEVFTNIGEDATGFICSNIEYGSSAGLLLFAIHSLSRSIPRDDAGIQNGRMTKRSLVAPNDRARQPCVLAFESEFDSPSIRDDAKRALWQRIEDRTRPKGQEANTACLLLRLATASRRDGEEELREDVDIEDLGENGLRLTFRFRYSG